MRRYAYENVPMLDEYKRDLCVYLDFLKSTGLTFFECYSNSLPEYHHYLGALRERILKLEINQGDWFLM